MREGLSFVIPWYGEHATGGAETECRRTVEELQRRGHDVEVLTTCIRSFRGAWVNHLPPGEDTFNGVRVRRFPAEPRDWRRFDEVNLKLMAGLSVSEAEAWTYMEEQVRSCPLEAYVQEQAERRRFVFIPYMFGTTFYGSAVAPQRSFLIPCLHDEVYARLPPYRQLFRQVRGVLCHSRAERDLAMRLYGVAPEHLHLIGEGVDFNAAGVADRFRARSGIDRPFLLYVGRKDGGKNFEELLRYYLAYRDRQGDRLELVFIGSGQLPEWGLQPGVHDLGFVDEQTKFDAHTAALALCNPSRNESFSIVLMESWLCGRPGLVPAGCAVTVEHCLASNGGLFYHDFREFEACVDWLLEHPHEARRMGELGGEFVRRNFNWDRVIGRLSAAVYA